MFYLLLAIVMLGLTIIALIGYDARDMFREPAPEPEWPRSLVAVPDFVPEDIMDLPYVGRVTLTWQQHGFKAISNWEDEDGTL